MRPFVITTDTTCDLPEAFIKENNIDIHSLFYRFGDDVYGGDSQLTAKEFFDRLRNGEMPTTMGTNPEDSKDLFSKRVEQGMDIIHIAFSSALSVSYQSACIAAEEVCEKHPEARIKVIDTKSASMGEGLLVYYAVKMQKEGVSFEKTVTAIEEMIPHVSQHFTVDDLFHLHRGGRVSKSTAIVGTLAGIKPNLCLTEEGGLEAYTKVRGRKKALNKLVDTMEELMGSYKEQNEIIMVVHDDTTQDAEYVAQQIQERLGIKNVMLNTICPTIGAHTGAGVIGVFFLADKRR